MAPSATPVAFYGGHPFFWIRLRPSSLGLYLRLASPTTAHGVYAPEAFETFPSTEAVFDGPMAHNDVDPQVLLARYLDVSRRIDVQGTSWQRLGATLSVVGGVASMRPGKETAPGATFALQGSPELVRDGRVAEEARTYTSFSWSLALCLLPGNELALAIHPSSALQLAARCVERGALAAFYIDGGRSTYFQVRGHEPLTSGRVQHLAAVVTVAPGGLLDAARGSSFASGVSARQFAGAVLLGGVLGGLVGGVAGLALPRPTRRIKTRSR